jgi:glutamine synthetase
MLHGISNKLDPGEATDQTATGHDENLPLDIRSALAATQSSKALGDVMGQDFVELYCQQRSNETNLFENYINTRELDWYL